MVSYHFSMDILAADFFLQQQQQHHPTLSPQPKRVFTIVSYIIVFQSVCNQPFLSMHMQMIGFTMCVLLMCVACFVVEEEEDNWGHGSRRKQGHQETQGIQVLTTSHANFNHITAYTFHYPFSI